MKNFYLIKIAYNGTTYNGWQSQPCGNTIQDYIKTSLERLFKTEIRLNGSSRTDAGVHAIGMFASFEVPASPIIPIDNIKHFLNHSLPKSILIKNIQEVNEKFHARYSACSKTYTYVINRSQNENPFLSNFTWHLPKFSNIIEVEKSLSFIEGYYDFSAFTVKRNNIDNAYRHIYKTEIIEIDDFVCINITGNGFLYKMVRSILGSLKEIGMNKYPAEELLRILNSKDRAQGSKTAPPTGLYLMDVYYEKDKWNDFDLTSLPFLNY